MSLNGQVAIVLGASRGIGADIAKHLAKNGAKVAVAARTETVNDPRLPGTIHSVTSEIQEAGGIAKAVVLNMRDPESIQAGIDATVEEWGQLDIVVNNAAVHVHGALEHVQPRHVQLAIDVNFLGPFWAMRSAVPYLRASGGGHIINLSSRGALFPGVGPYDTSIERRGDDILYGPIKAGIEHLTQGQARELQDENIAVNVLSPEGRILTPGSLYPEQDRENPSMDFEAADKMGLATVWICEQNPQEFTGNILYDEKLCAEQSLSI
jgi:citronellol/citronellal dehydrogenase